MTAVLPEVMPPLIVDRSPELRRGSEYKQGNGAYGSRWLTITQKDIDEAQRGDGANCALARMIKKAFGEETQVNIQGENPTVMGKTIQLAPEIIDWIGRFDRGEEVQPFDICIDFNG